MPNPEAGADEWGEFDNKAWSAYFNTSEQRRDPERQRRPRLAHADALPSQSQATLRSFILLARGEHVSPPTGHCLSTLDIAPSPKHLPTLRDY